VIGNNTTKHRLSQTGYIRMRRIHRDYPSQTPDSIIKGGGAWLIIQTWWGDKQTTTDEFVGMSRSFSGYETVRKCVEERGPMVAQGSDSGIARVKKMIW
jgi:hypothetical protein